MIMHPRKLGIKHLAIVFLFYLSTACISPASTAFPFDENQTPEATFDAGKDFECWTAPASLQPVSPSSRLLVVSDHGNDRLDLYLFDFASERFSLLASGVGRYGTGRSPVSPDGRYVWYSRYRKDRSSDDIFTLNLDDSREWRMPWMRRIAAEGTGFAWSWDSNCLFISDYDRLMAFRLSDSVLQEKVLPPKEWRGGFDISFNGRWWAAGCDGGICIHDLEMGKLSQYRFEGGVEDARGGALPRWSPDGKMLAYADDGYHTARGVNDRVRLVVFLDDGGPVVNNLWTDKHIVRDLLWSPDGQKLLIVGSAASLEIYDCILGKVVSVQVSESEEKSIYAATWLPDSEQIAFVTNDPPMINVANLDGIVRMLPLPDESVKYLNSIYLIP